MSNRFFLSTVMTLELVAFICSANAMQKTELNTFISEIEHSVPLSTVSDASQQNADKIIGDLKNELKNKDATTVLMEITFMHISKGKDGQVDSDSLLLRNDVCGGILNVGETVYGTNVVEVGKRIDDFNSGICAIVKDPTLLTLFNNMNNDYWHLKDVTGNPLPPLTPENVTQYYINMNM